MQQAFNYQKKVWGASSVGLSKTYLGYLRLKYCLDDLQTVTGKVLDVGCGAGGFTSALKHYRPDLSVYGVDIGKKAIASAKKYYPHVAFSTGDIYALPYKNAQFDGIVIEDVLEHLEHPEKAIAEIERVLKPQGVFHAFIPLEGSVFSLHRWLYTLGWRAKEKHAGHIQQLTLQKVRAMLVKHNLLINTQRYSGHLFGQFIDVGYFSFLDISGRQMSTGLEHYLEQKNQKWNILGAMKDSVTIIVNQESLLFSRLPGFGIHIKATKRQ